eukprot:scaffold10072_cov112-Skeletonema_marinoi.AAC.3
MTSTSTYFNYKEQVESQMTPKTTKYTPPYLPTKSRPDDRGPQPQDQNNARASRSRCSAHVQSSVVSSASTSAT